MLERGTQFNSAKQPKFIVPGQPEIFDPIPEIIPAKDVGTLRCSGDLYPENKPYAVYAIKNKGSRPKVISPRVIEEIRTIIDTSEKEQDTVSKADVEKKPSSTIFLVTGGDFTDPKEVNRRFDRGADRVQQYERLLRLITDSETKLQHGQRATYHHIRENHQIIFEFTQDDIEKLKRMADSFEKELEEEPAIKELVKGVKERIYFEPEIVIKAAEEEIFDNQRKQFEEIEIKHEELPYDADPNISNKSREEKEEEQTSEIASPVQEIAEQKPEEAPLVEKEIVAIAEQILKQNVLNTEAVLAVFEELVTIDMPSQEAVDYLKKLLNTPF